MEGEALQKAHMVLHDVRTRLSDNKGCTVPDGDRDLKTIVGEAIGWLLSAIQDMDTEDVESPEEEHEIRTRYDEINTVLGQLRDLELHL